MHIYTESIVVCCMINIKCTLSCTIACRKDLIFVLTDTMKAAIRFTLDKYEKVGILSLSGDDKVSTGIGVT